jgi:hypothetical protein
MNFNTSVNEIDASPHPAGKTTLETASGRLPKWLEAHEKGARPVPL